jgi:hypothetical protein
MPDPHVLYNQCMVYRGTVQGGVVVLSDPGALPEGTAVEVRPKRGAKVRGKVKPVAGRSDSVTGRSRKAPSRAGASGTPSLKPLPGFGMWKNRADWRGKSTLTIARELRRKAMGERYRG